MDPKHELSCRAGPDEERRHECARCEFADRAGELERTHERLVKVNRAFRMLAGCTQDLLRAADEKSLLQEICRTIVSVGGYSLAWVGYAEFDDEKTVRPVAWAGAGADEYLSTLRLSWADNVLGEGPTGTAIRTGERAVNRNLSSDPKYAPWRDKAARFGYEASIAIPLYCDMEILGALNVYSREGDAFDDEEMRLLEELAGDMAYGISSIRIRADRQVAEEELLLSWARLTRTLQGVIRAMGAVTELRDPYTAGHQQRVSELAEAIAREMGLPEQDVEGVRTAGIVHDVGKVYVPIQILSKPGILTPIEYNLVKVHSEAGYDILKNVEFPWPTALTVLQHHERMDGSGYPGGLRGDQIIVPARIIAVADTVEAMSNFRPYRPAPGLDKALQEILSRDGEVYDRGPADACARLFNEKGFRFANQRGF